MSGYGSIYGDYYGGPRRHRQKPSKGDNTQAKETSTLLSGSPKPHDNQPTSEVTTNPTTTGEAIGGNHSPGLK
ncbi:hypothetical protein Dsin_023927 [Dipteronia sinensis]|uniref:Uncharacterized protein n=1 Tax=Dipteronia sinensis TaxID=43782 RepID=A0AAE0A559_9ROSI|nr:hypothetical protein Dsin_023927 [Dipteronia sinensis]